MTFAYEQCSLSRPLSGFNILLEVYV
jgi:hypothetical protein